MNVETSRSRITLSYHVDTTIVFSSSDDVGRYDYTSSLRTLNFKVYTPWKDQNIHSPWHSSNDVPQSDGEPYTIRWLFFRLIFLEMLTGEVTRPIWSVSFSSRWPFGSSEEICSFDFNWILGNEGFPQLRLVITLVLNLVPKFSTRLHVQCAVIFSLYNCTL